MGTIELGDGTRPHGLRAVPNGELLVTAEGTKSLLIVDPKNRRVLARTPTDREVSHMVVATPDGARAFVANIGSGSVTAVDLRSRKVLKEIPTGQGAEGLDITPDGREVWVVNRGADNLSIIDSKSLAVLEQVKVAQFPIRVKFTPDGKRALVSCARSGDLAVFDAPKRREIKRIPLGREAIAGSEKRLFSNKLGTSPAPVGLLMAPDGKRAWVASTNADVVTEISLDSLEITRRLTAGKEPDGLAGWFEKRGN